MGKNEKEDQHRETTRNLAKRLKGTVRKHEKSVKRAFFSVPPKPIRFSPCMDQKPALQQHLDTKEGIAKKRKEKFLR